MHLFNLRNGPWEILFEGTLHSLETGIYTNSRKDFLIIILDKEGHAIKGALTQFYTVFLVEGEIDSLIQEKESIALIRSEGFEKHKFLLIPSSSEYIAWKEKEFIEKTSQMFKELEELKEKTKETAKKLKLNAVSLNECKTEVKEGFLNQPLLAPLISSQLKEKETSNEIKIEKSLSGEVILGLNRENILISEPFSLFKKTIASGNEDLNRIHLLHVLIEGLLLSNIDCIAFEFEEKFKGLDTPTSKLNELKASKIEIEPIGFPVKKFQAKQEIKVDLNLLKAESLMDLFGVTDKELIEFLEARLREKEHTDLQEFIQTLKESLPSTEVNQYQINKVIRIFKLIDSKYPRMLGGANPIQEITKSWLKEIGKISIIDLQEVKDEKEKLLFITNIVKGILESQKEITIKSKLKLMLFIPNSFELIGKEKNNEMSKELIELLMQAEKHGIGFVLETNQKTDLKDEVVEQMESELTLVSGIDLGVSLPGKTHYRIKVRPTLSKQVDE